MANNPIIFHESNYSLRDLKVFKKQNPIWKILDIYEDQLKELFEINNPEFSKNEEKLMRFIEEKKDLAGNWIYFPWNGTLLHTVSEEDYYRLRTNRNQNLITSEEQETLKNSCVGVVGLSIGSHFAISAVQSGFSNTIKLAENDTLETSNLNRIRARIEDISSEKIDIMVKQIYEINPYADPILFPSGLNQENLDLFFTDKKKLSIVFEAIDDLKMKILIRLKAKALKIPVVMLTNIEDRLLIDIERYDLHENLPLFNGLIEDIQKGILNDELEDKDLIKYIIGIVGQENITDRVQKSLLEINKTLVGRPQLYSTVAIGGGVAAYIIKKIILKENSFSGRKILDLNHIFIN